MKTIPSLPVYWLSHYHVFWYNKTIKNNPLASGDNLPRWKNPRVMHPASPKCTLFSEMHPTPGKCTLLFWKCTLKSQKCTRVLFLGAFFYQNMSTKPSRACNQADYRLFPFSETGNSVLFHFFGEKIIRSPQHQSISTGFRSRRPPAEQALSPSPVPR